LHSVDTLVQDTSNYSQESVNNFKFSVSAAPWALKGAPVLLCSNPMRPLFEQAKKLGYDALELHLLTPKDAPVQEIAELCREFGINISAVATGLSKLVEKLCFIDEDPKVRAAAVKRIKEFIDWCEILKCGVIIGSMRGVIPDPDNRVQEDQRMAECLQEILSYSESKEVPIYLEVINRYENNYLNTAKETLEYINKFNSEYLFVHLDTFHMNIEESSMEEAILLCSDKLGYIHVADNTRRTCGEGSIDFKKVLDALNKISYKGYVSVECLPIPDGVTAAKNSISHLKNI
jgi:sugar phosphate isomerase/epimerase